MGKSLISCFLTHGVRCLVGIWSFNYSQNFNRVDLIDRLYVCYIRSFVVGYRVSIKY